MHIFIRPLQVNNKAIIYFGFDSITNYQDSLCHQHQGSISVHIMFIIMIQSFSMAGLLVSPSNARP